MFLTVCSYYNIVKPLKSGHLPVFKNLSVIEKCPLLGGNLKKIVTFRTKCFVPYLGCPLVGGFTIAAAIKKDCSYRNNCGIQLHDGDLEHDLMKEKNRCLYVFLPIFMFWHSRFSFRNLKDANSCMFS